MQQEPVATIEMPRYLCHKKVWALKIKRMQAHTDHSATLHFEDERYAPIDVDIDYLRKHEPESGGYYVVYDDGYKSFSLAKAFEEGYTLITGDPDNDTELSASEALYGFIGWLTGRKEKMLLGANCDCVPIAEAISEFEKVNHLSEPKDGWEKRLVKPEN